MYMRSALYLTAALVLGACSASLSGSGDAATPGTPLPEEVMAVVAPDQDLTTVRLRPEDNCYWYLHSGPVETTLVPLRTVSGNPICLERTS